MTRIKFGKKLGYSSEQLQYSNIIQEIIVKTLVAIQPKLSHLYNTCFPNDIMGNSCCELLGFDVILEKKKEGIKPWLLEVHQTLSYKTHVITG